MSRIDPRVYGQGLRLVDDDLVLGPSGFELVSGLEALAQDLSVQLRSVPGDLAWNPEAGLPLELFVEGDLDPLELRRLEVEAAAEVERDGRVEAGTASVSAVQTGDEELELQIVAQPIASPEPLALVVPLTVPLPQAPEPIEINEAEAELSALWAVFEPGIYFNADSVASQLHGVNGDYWYACLLRAEQAGNGFLHELWTTAESGPYARLIRNGGDKSRYSARFSNFVTAASKITSGVVYANPPAEVLLCWATEDEGLNAGLYSMINGGAPVYYGAGSELRQSFGANWPPDKFAFGGRLGELTAQVGWVGAGTGKPQAIWPDIWAAYAGDRRNLHSGFVDAGMDVVFSCVLDELNSADAGPDPVWTGAVTYEEVA